MIEKRHGSRGGIRSSSGSRTRCGTRHRPRLCLAIAAVLLATSAEGASAQFLGQPVSHRPSRDPWPAFYVNVDYSIGHKEISDLQVLTGRFSVEGDRWRFGLGAGAVFADSADTEAVFGSSVAYGFLDQNFNVVGLDAQAGVGTARRHIGEGGTVSLRQWDFPLGAAVGISGRTPFNLTIEPWFGVRGHFRNSSFDENSGGGSDWRGGIGTSLGLYVTFGPGVGVQLAFDRLWIRDPSEPRWQDEISWGFGGHVGF